MDLFDCKVKLANSNDNEVRKEKVTAAEIIVLRKIHGVDAVVDIVGRDAEKRKDDAERERLAKEYGAKLVTDLFGADHNPLPNIVPGLGEVKKRIERAKLPADIAA